MRALTFFVLILLILPANVFAADFGWAWPIAPSRDESGAYLVELSSEVYEATTDPRVSDLIVRNANGEEVPSALMPAENVVERADSIELPLFDLPPQWEHHNLWTISRETRTQGRVERVETEHLHSHTGPPVGVLVDASRVRDPIEFLELEWSPDHAPLDIEVIIESSSDFETWHVSGRGKLVDLQADSERVLLNKLRIDRSQRYLRVRAVKGLLVPILSVSAHLAPQSSDPKWQWTRVVGDTTFHDEYTEIIYTNPGRFPVKKADIELEENSAARWKLESRDSLDQPWRYRAGSWVGFNLGGDVASRSAARELEGVVRDRYFRLTSDAPTLDEPKLLLGWQPETLVFLARGQGPYELLAGSHDKRRINAPVPELVSTLKSHFGEAWRPLPAYLGPMEEREGDAASVAPVEVEKTPWILWTVLVLGCALVAGISISLLKR